MTGGAVLLAVALTTACSPEPAPTPTPTGFASEEEAFAAAEATYRAYVDALNEVDLSDPRTFEPVFAQLSGDALANEKKSLTAMHADDWAVSGGSSVADFEGERYQSSIVALSCLDVSEIKVTDADGTSQVDPTRPDIYSLRLVFELKSGTLRIADMTPTEDERCASS